MRLLYLTAGFPYPLTSGFLRHYFLLRELCRAHRITLLSLAGPTLAPDHVSALEPFADRVVTVPAGTPPPSRARKAMARLRSTGGADPAVTRMGQAVAELATPFDVVVTGKRTVPAIDPLNGVPVVADMCDATSMRIRRSLAHVERAAVPFTLVEYQRTRRNERALMRRAAHSVFISHRDREDLVGDATAGTTIVPNGVDTDYWQRTRVPPAEDTIVFTGAMSYRPNADAARVLTEEVFPRVRHIRPRAKLYIVGRDPGPRLLDAGRQPGVTVTGEVPDVRPYLEQATVFAAPLRFGSGMQNKVLEALAMEVPVVASRLAADGLRTEQGEQPPVDVADSPEEFARTLVDKLNGGPAQPASLGRRFVQAHYSWASSGAKLHAVLEHVTSRG